MTIGKIGRMDLDIAHYTDMKDSTETGVETSVYDKARVVKSGGGTSQTKSFKIVLLNWQAQAVVGIAELQELIWIDTSNVLSHQDRGPRGFVVLKSVDLSYVNPDYKEADISYEEVSVNPNDWLRYHYSRGVNDPTKLPLGDYYILTASYTAWDEPFDSYRTAVWNTAIKGNVYSGASENAQIVSDGAGKMLFQAKSLTNGKWGYVAMQSKSAIMSAPGVIYFDLERGSIPTAGAKPYMMSFMISNAPWGASIDSADSFLRVSYSVDNLALKIVVERYIYKKGWVTFYSETLPGSNTIVNFKMRWHTDWGVELYRDIGDGNGLIKVLGKVSLGWNPFGLYFGFALWNNSNVYYTAKVSRIYVEKEGPENLKNIVPGPISTSSKYSITPTAYRAGSEGNIPVFDSITVPLYFKTDPLQLHKGAVTAYSSNNPDGVFRPIYTSNDLIDPTKFYMDNTLIRIETDTRYVYFKYWNGSAWAICNQFDFGANGIATVNIVDASSDVIKLQIEDTYWTLSRGKYAVYVEHPTRNLIYVRKNRYLHDKTGDPTVLYEDSTIVADDVDVAMNANYLCGIYNSTDTYRMLVLKLIPQNIKSNYIPADYVTGIGVYNSGASAPNDYGTISKEFYYQTRGKIGIERL